MLLVEDAIFNKFVNRLLRLAAAAALGDVARIRGHSHKVEICSEAVKHRKGDVEEEVSVHGSWSNSISLVSDHKRWWYSLGRMA